ncbi:hypothetical protein [Winogradskyella sp. 3972H.M.0a.05]|uniref:hypothetical protein n=1 Tax=Winogradskyella sp. 3972H.M.0a.05 TaxID=2950277 RepID=UPI003396F145
MKKLEIALSFLIGIAFIMKLMNWPYNSLILALSATLLGMLYFGLGFILLNGIRLRDIAKKSSYQHISALGIIGAICLGFVFSFIVIYMLFKIQFWPYGQMGLKLSLGMLLVSIVVFFIFYVMKRRRLLKENIIRIIIIGGLGTLLYFTDSMSLVELFYRNDPDRLEHFRQEIQNLEVYETRRKDSTSSAE